MQQRIYETKRFTYSKRGTAGTFRPSQEVEPKYYSQAKETPLKAFKKACNGDLKALVLSGNPTEEELKKALFSITDEYHSIVDGNQSRIAKQRDYLRLEMKIYVLHTIIYFSGDSVLKELKETFNILSIKSAEATLKRWKVELNMKANEMKSEDKGEKVDVYRHYSELQQEISKYQGYAVKDDTTVYDFALQVKSYNDYLNQLKKKNNGRGKY